MRSTAHILVVDDNRSLVQIIEHLLRQAGFEILTAFDGMEGLTKARNEKPDLVILDIVMPEIDGYQVCRSLQSDPETATIPVLMLTVKGQLEADTDDKICVTRIKERIDGFDAGATDFLSKPVKAKDLLDRVNSLLWFEGFPVLQGVGKEIKSKGSECQDGPKDIID